MYDGLLPDQCRALISRGDYQGPTAGMARGYVQANLVILPLEIADDFKQFAQLNPQACPLLEVLVAGKKVVETVAIADVATSFPAYRYFEYSEVVEDVPNVSHLWRDDLVSFLIGCSYTTDQCLLEQGIILQHVLHNTTVPIYITDRITHPTRFFSGPMVVSMRPIKKHQVDLAVSITRDYPLAHGAPICVGDPGQLGIANLSQPAYGTFYPLQSDEVPVFWACGVTPQLCAQHKEIDFMITHKPGHMLICDLKNHDLYKKESV